MALSWGVDGDRFLVLNPIEGETAIDMATDLINTGAFGVAVLDSVSSLIPSYDLEEKSEKDKMGAHAKLVTRAVNKLLTASVRTNSLLIFINQVRADLKNPYGGLITSGGYHLEHQTSVKLKVFTKGKAARLIKNGKWYGHRAYIKVEKTQMSIPIDYEIEIALEYGKRINMFMELISIGSECGLIEKSGGSWFIFSEDNKIQGQDNAALYLENNPEFAEQLKEKIYEIGTYNPLDIISEAEEED